MNPLNVMKAAAVLSQAMEEAENPLDLAMCAAALMQIHSTEQEIFVPKMHKDMSQRLKENPGLEEVLRANGKSQAEIDALRALAGETPKPEEKPEDPFTELFKALKASGFKS